MVDTLQQGESHGVELLLMWNGRHPGLVKLELEALAEIYDSRAGVRLSFEATGQQRPGRFLRASFVSEGAYHVVATASSVPLLAASLKKAAGGDNDDETVDDDLGGLSHLVPAQLTPGEANQYLRTYIEVIATGSRLRTPEERLKVTEPLHLGTVERALRRHRTGASIADRRTALLIDRSSSPAVVLCERFCRGFLGGKAGSKGGKSGSGLVADFGSGKVFNGVAPMDVELAFVMSNVASVSRGDIVFDPFVGSASTLLPASHFGAFCMGSDADYTILAGDGSDRNARSNAKLFGLPASELVGTSATHGSWVLRNVVDAIICDPPYGIRTTNRGNTGGGGNTRTCTARGHRPTPEQQQLWSVCPSCLLLALDAALAPGGKAVLWCFAASSTQSDASAPAPTQQVQSALETLIADTLLQRTLTVSACASDEVSKRAVARAEAAEWSRCLVVIKKCGAKRKRPCGPDPAPAQRPEGGAGVTIGRTLPYPLSRKVLRGLDVDIWRAGWLNDKLALEEYSRSGGSLDSRDTEGRTPLMYAAAYGHVATIAWLLEHRVSLEEQDNMGLTALMHASKHGKVDATQLLLDDLVQADARAANVVHQRDKCGYSAAFWAVSFGHADVLTRLLAIGARCPSEGVEPSSLYPGGTNLLHRAAERGKTSCVEILCSSYPELVNSRDARERTPAHWAARFGFLEALQVLGKHGCDFGAVDAFGEDVAEAAGRYNRSHITLWLIEQSKSQSSEVS